MKIGIDLGGTKIEGIVVAADGSEVARKRVGTPRGDYAPILRTVKQLIDDLERRAGEPCTVGIGTPGSLNPDGLLRNSNTVEMNRKPFLRDLQALCEREIRISNDANCFALSEATDGAAQGAKIVFGVILGTGVGGGIVINGEVLTGRNAIGGEWGHNPLPWPKPAELPGPKCYCGQLGCIETFLSGPGLAQTYFQISQSRLSPEQILASATDGDEQAETVLSLYEDQLARALGHVVNIIDPDCIVLGGGLSNIQRLYDNVPMLWRRYIFSDVITTALLPPQHGDASGVRGAAWLW